MITEITEITKDAIDRFNDIYEFRAFTQFSYKRFGEIVAQGYKATAIIPHTGQTADQTTIQAKLKEYESKYLLELSFQYSISVFEAWFFDLLRILLSDPNRLNKKRKIDVSDVINSKTLEDLIRTVIEAELNEIQYKKPAEWFGYLWTFVKIEAPSIYDIERISEIKASRDILVHNNGIANQIYVLKSGSCARVKEGEPISITPDYLNESWTLLRQVTDIVGKLVAEKI